jgi:DNA-binding CsgD family transcriptional regulator
MIETDMSYQADWQYARASSFPAHQGKPPIHVKALQHDLSKREVEIMQWLKIGKTNREIGCILDISPCTVKNHLQRIFKKLTVFNRTHAVTKFFIATQNPGN